MKNQVSKILGILAKGIFILCIPILCLTMTVGWEIITPQIYTYGFDKYYVSHIIDFSETDLRGIANDFVRYFKSAEEDIHVTVMREGVLENIFTPEEIIHFRDVKRVIRFNRNLMLAALGYVALSVIWWGRKGLTEPGRLFMAGAGLTLVLMTALVLGLLLKFDWLFLEFHIFIFANDYWYFPGVMLKLFPLNFWYDVALFTILVTSVLTLIFGGMGYGLTYLTRKKARTP